MHARPIQLYSQDYMGKRGALDDALASFAMAYAARTQRDYDQLLKSKRGAAKQS
jgi:hypothetical protein